MAKVKKIKDKILPHGQRGYIGDTIKDVESIIKYCHFLKDKINELIVENEELKRKIERINSTENIR